MDRHCENAYRVAHWLREHPRVKKVYYVGFEDHKDYAVTKKQTTGFGGMISFELDSEETAQRLLWNVRMIVFAESLGATEQKIIFSNHDTNARIHPEGAARGARDKRTLYTHLCRD